MFDLIRCQLHFPLALQLEDGKEGKVSGMERGEERRGEGDSCLLISRSHI